MAERESELTTREVRDARDTHHQVRDPVRAPARSVSTSSQPEPHAPRSDVHGIRQDINETRQRLDKTIDTLQLRLSPRYMAQQTMDKIKHQSSQAGHGFTRTLRENPLPAIVSGIGLAWLFGASVRRGKEEEPGSHYREVRGPEDAELRARRSLYQAGMESQGTAYPPPSSYQSYGEGGQVGESKSHQLREQAQAYGSQAREKVQAYGQQAREKASEYSHRAAETASHLRERASEMGHHMREQASETGERLRSSSQHAQESARNLFNDHPISVGLGVMAAGMALGLLLPSTRKEDELIGEQRDKLFEQAQSYGEDLADRGKAVAARAGEAAKEAASEEAHEQGLAGGEESGSQGGGEGGSEQQPS